MKGKFDCLKYNPFVNVIFQVISQGFFLCPYKKWNTYRSNQPGRKKVNKKIFYCIGLCSPARCYILDTAKPMEFQRSVVKAF